MTAWKLSLTVKGLRPLAVLSDGIVCYCRGAIYKVGFDLRKSKLLCNLPAFGLKGRLAQSSRFVDRIFRESPSHALVLNETLLVARRTEIWRLDLRNGHLSLDFNIPDGRRSLSFGLISHSDGTQEIVFGEYFSNASRLPVRIWGRSADDVGWTERAVFPNGEIEHVHAVSFVNGKIYVLTGDFGSAAGIWVADESFSNLQPLVRGKQQYRAAWMAELAGRVFYATDTQLEFNNLYDFQLSSGTLSIFPLFKIRGSSIYAGRGPSEIFFSTTVECGEPTGNFIRDLLDTKPGPGMQSSAATLMAVDESGGVSELYSALKDFLPFRLAQFGTFVFPSGMMPPNCLIAYGVALNGIDDTCLLFTRN